MPTITVADRTAPISTTQATQPAQDTRRLAAIAQIEKGGVETPSPDASNMRQDASGRVDEANPSTAPATPPAKDPSEDHIARLAAREKQAWAQIKQLKTEKAALEADKAKATEGRLTKDEYNQLLRTDPTKVGLTMEELGNLYLQGSAPVDPMVARLQAEIEALKGTVTQAKTDADKSTQAAYDSALKQIDTEVKALVATNPAYEITRAQGAENAVTKLIELTFQEEGTVMDVAEAAAAVEAQLEEEALALFGKSQKLKAKLQPAAPNATEASNPAPAQTRTARTLTPEMSQASTKPLDRKQRAILAFEGKLKD